MDLCLRKLSHRNHKIILILSFPKSSVFKMFSVHTNFKAKSAFSISSGPKSIFEKIRFRDVGLVWKVSLTVGEKKNVFKFLRRSLDQALGKNNNCDKEKLQRQQQQQQKQGKTKENKKTILECFVEKCLLNNMINRLKQLR